MASNPQSRQPHPPNNSTITVSGTILLVYEPFWKDYPWTDIHLALTPDVLHQIHQGVFAKLLHWCQQAMTKKEMDLRIQKLPPTYGVRHFSKGLSGLVQVTGPERKQMAKILLACLIGKLPRKAILASRHLLDFIHLAQYQTHDEDTLGYLGEALKGIHANKDIFIELGCRSNFNFPKLHSLVHYIPLIRLFGTTDNYNTEMFERLHIDFAKQG
ncbi:hypothetical protein HGRIS_003379 [Hohenbuehelia grisea]|uniref:Uncharacterized protein n=1 Tax=Hohenbuehelia grisea TaxID=104357 RepID=A0ABR3JF80_9AGAR